MQYLGNSIYLKCFLLLLLFRLVPSVEVVIEAWAMCMISLQQGCIRKSDSDSSNNGTSHLLSVTWLQQEPCKFPAIKFWQVAGNQYNIPHVPCCTWERKKRVFNILSVAGLEDRLTHRQCWVTGGFLLCWAGYKRPPSNMDTHQQESFHCTPPSKSQTAFRAVIHWFLANNSLSPHHQFSTACTCPARFLFLKDARS